jgi:putative pyrroloquinoline-quinone binding quinoprotein
MRTGELLWQAVSGVATGFNNGLIAVDIERKLAYVAGWIRWVPGSLNQEAFLVQAYETETGTLRWEDQFPGSNPFVRRCPCHASDLSVDNGRVYAVGVGIGSEGAASAWLIRSYDAKRGDRLWSDTFVPAGGTGFDPSARVTVAVDRGRAFAGGFGFDASADADFIVRAYDAR